VKTKPLQIVSSDEFWAIERKFVDAHHARQGHLQLDKQAANYARFYDTLVRYLRTVGTHCEGFSGADFTTSRDVDPNDVTVVVSDTKCVFESGALEVAAAAIRDTGAPHMIIFDTGSYIAVLPDGSVIGYSETEELLRYGQVTGVST
jgi:hypothetical protein